MGFGRDRDHIPPVDLVPPAPSARRVTDGDALTSVDSSDRHNVSLILDVTWKHHGDEAGVRDGTVLEHISWIIMATVRTTDIVYRHGHAQYCVRRPASPSDAGDAVADRIRVQIDQSEVLSTLGIVLQVSVDGGGPSTEDVDESVDRAIGALDEAASSGPRIASEMSEATPSRRRSTAAGARTTLAVQRTGAPVPPLGDLPSALLPD